MKIIKMEVGELGANCYILYCENTLKGAVIDPGGNGKDIVDQLKTKNLVIEYILNTHGHADHIAANDEVKKATGAPIYIHADDGNMLSTPQGNLSSYIGRQLICQPADHLLHGGETLTLGELELEIIHTPGHTRGGVCIKVDNIVFTGDTLFAHSIGRSDFPGGSHNQLIQSIKTNLLILADETIVLPGHGGATTIGDERRHNSFLQ